MTARAWTPCVICEADVMIAVEFEHQLGPGINALAPLGASIDDIACCHALENAEWLASPEGQSWQSARLEEYLGPARRPA